MSGSSAHVRWKCLARGCGVTATIPQLHNTKLDELDTAVSSGHARRAAECHERNGVSKIRGEMNGMTVRFPLVPSDRPINVASDSRTTDDLDSSNTAAPG